MPRNSAKNISLGYRLKPDPRKSKNNASSGTGSTRFCANSGMERTG